MEDLKKAIASYASKELEQRKNWYSPAAEAYNRVRPHYPKAFIDRVVAIAQLSSHSKILEVGCGPATATVSFAPLSCPLLCLEPNPNFYQLAQQNCQSYPNVEIQNISFEEWTLEEQKFDAVLAASSFHWIPSEVAYPKAAKALKKNGCLILLWNKELQPSYDVYQHLSKVYQAHAPFLDRYEVRETQQEILKSLGQMALDSGQFNNLIDGQVESEAIYSVDEYLMLLNTYSPYLKLDLQTKKALFTDLKKMIEQDFDGNLRLTFISAFHIARK